MTRYRLRVQEVEAIQWNGAESWDAVCAWVGEGARRLTMNNQGTLFVPTLLDGVKPAEPGWWLVRDETNEAMPYHPARFDALYEPVQVEKPRRGKANPEKAGERAANPRPNDADDSQADPTETQAGDVAIESG